MVDPETDTSIEVYWGELWPAGVALADGILAGDIAVPPGREAVVDLGCGTGIVAVAAARAGGGKTGVLATDRESKSLALARLNAERNGVANLVTPRIVDWSVPYTNRHPLLLAADCLYNPEGVVLLLDFIRQALAKTAEARAVLADPDRWSARDFNYHAQQAGFSVRHSRRLAPFTAVQGPIEWLPQSGPPTDSEHPITDDGVDVSIYELRWR